MPNPTLIRMRDPKRASTFARALSAALGGLLGNGIGHGIGRAAATVAGAVVGGIGGNAVEHAVTRDDGQEIIVRLGSGHAVAIGKAR